MATGLIGEYYRAGIAMIDAREKKTILVVAALASFLVPFTGSSITVALPAMAAQFHADAVTLGWITSAYIIAAAVFIVPFGRYADIVGRKKIFLIGLLIYTLASFACAFAPDEALLIGGRFIQGIGGAMLFATSLAIVTQVFGPGERGAALGITIATVYAGLSLGPFLGGILTDHFGWPAIFLVNVPLGLLTIALTLHGIRHEWADAAGELFDRYGAVAYGIMLFCLIYGMLLFPDPAGVAWVLAALAAGTVFFWWEHRTKSPLIDLSVFSGNRTFVFSNIAAMINYGSTFGVGVLLSLYLQYIQGFPAESAGLILVAQPVVQMIFSPITGRLSDRIEPRIVATAGMALTTLGLFFFIFLAPSTPVWVIVACLMVMGLGYGLFSSPNTNAIMSSVEMKHLGIASGMNATMRSLGQLLSMAIAMFCFAIIIGPVSVTPAVYPQLMTSVVIAFIVFTLLCLVGVVTSFVRGTIHPDGA
ncbi:MFS transporter [Methanoregula sp.]|uniref:MFS transporter n=1 Tax=Methanoregula sp. TaxID=2052170 RepID=UPI0023709C21|nr:MFS transporter [Methanoregula sp.]MDD1686057.1 MFS transporter [Methanoregula sp.]